MTPSVQRPEYAGEISGFALREASKSPGMPAPSSRKVPESILLLILAVVYFVPAYLKADNGDVDGCGSLQHVDFSTLEDAPTRVLSSHLQGGSEDVPAHCKVLGYVSPQIGFDIRLPVSKWNGKLMTVGCGGLCGVLVSEQLGTCDEPLRRGYACIASDLGHRGDGMLWAYNNVQAELDFAYRATHVVAIAGKALVRQFYRNNVQKSYLIGCSSGGRQGLLAAQRFPTDFDGIVAGAPNIDFVAFFASQLKFSKALRDDGVPYDRWVVVFKTLHDAVLKRCDLDDGVRDGVVGNPMACDVDPGELRCSISGRDEGECLSDTEVGVTREIYTGLRSEMGEVLHPGPVRGSELDWINYLDVGLQKAIADAFPYLLLTPDPGRAWNPAEFDPSRDYARLAMADVLYSASNPDLRRFKARGGKIIMFQGWNDTYAMPGRTVDYYETVERTMGGRRSTEDFFRLFMLPGVGHCANGPGADAMDLLRPLEEWVEGGHPPDAVTAGHIEDNGKQHYPYRWLPADRDNLKFTRPLYPFPRRAVYSGAGSARDAASFHAQE